MAILTKEGLRGILGDAHAFEKYTDKVVLTAFPYKKKSQTNDRQKFDRDCFARAKERATQDQTDPEVILACTPHLKLNQSLYSFLLSLYKKQEMQILKENQQLITDKHTILNQFHKKPQ